MTMRKYAKATKTCGLRSARTAGLLLRRILLAAFGVEPDRAPREAGCVEVALRADALEVQHRAQAARSGLRLDGAGQRLRRLAVRHRLRHHPADQFALG